MPYAALANSATPLLNTFRMLSESENWLNRAATFLNFEQILTSRKTHFKITNNHNLMVEKKCHHK
jgi:hypothetical protein